MRSDGPRPGPRGVRRDSLYANNRERSQGRRADDCRIQDFLEKTRAIPWEADARSWLFTYVGPQAKKLLGYPIRQWYRKDFWTSHIHPDDREFAVAYCLESSQRCTEYEFEYRMIAANGTPVWLHDVVYVALERGKPRFLRGFMIDVTERMKTQQALKRSQSALRESQQNLRVLAGKLLSAQEEERRRLARELHDDLTQRLATLAIELGAIEQGIVSLDPAARKKLRQLKDQIVRVSADTHGMSRRLHPSILDDLGLVAAIESECLGATKRDGIQFDFSAERVPNRIPKDVSIALYRIAQEALRNMAKHAKTKRAVVRLSGGGESIRLQLQDFGVGFAPRKARGGGGLGLASIKERVRLVQGQVSIKSRPRDGTTITVEVPLKRSE
ncbi:MAG: ATP-binding protein [Nitrospirota bacterium]